MELCGNKNKNIKSLNKLVGMNLTLTSKTPGGREWVPPYPPCPAWDPGGEAGPRKNQAAEDFKKNGASRQNLHLGLRPRTHPPTPMEGGWLGGQTPVKPKLKGILVWCAPPPREPCSGITASRGGSLPTLSVQPVLRDQLPDDPVVDVQRLRHLRRAHGPQVCAARRQGVAVKPGVVPCGMKRKDAYGATIVQEAR